MSALLDHIRPALPESQPILPFISEAAALVQNIDPHDLVAPLREVRTMLDDGAPLTQERASKVAGALTLQNLWQDWVAEREQLMAEFQRGSQCLQETRAELAQLRAKLADWSTHEVICGHNPLPELVQTIIVKEQIEKLLPSWLDERQLRLATVTRKMEACAKENGLEHLL